VQRRTEGPANAPAGLMGRQVAGKEFLDAYLTYGDWSELLALVFTQPSAQSLARHFQTHPANLGRQRSLKLFGARSFLQSFFPTPPAPVLYTPVPPDSRFAWMRQHGGPGAFSLCGVTHTLCTATAVNVLCDMVTAPYEPHDALICTSQAVTRMVRSLTDRYADYLRERHGGTPALQLRLETIPLGVNPDRFCPPTPEQRSTQRAKLQIADDEVAVLFVGRFTPHAKAHPYPIFQGLARAAQMSGRKVHLVLAGWGNPDMINAFTQGAKAFAPGVRVSLIDGTHPEMRFAMWHAADLFTSLVDNIQETFGLVIIEAMASGLPVIATDWDGYRDLVVDGETGYRVPTYMIHGATRDATANLLFQGTSYDEFLAASNQTVTVDLAIAAQAYARLIGDPALRRRMGEAGRQRVLERFTWQHVIRAYEELWQSQESERLAYLAQAAAPARTYLGPARYPAPEETFACYPTEVLGDDDAVQAVPGGERVLEMLQALPLTNYAAENRSREPAVLRAILAAAAAPCSLAELDRVFASAGVDAGIARATLGWMLKYGLLQVA
jgi:glycosyltransferase involved in cell wall biosynthesis